MPYQIVLTKKLLPGSYQSLLKFERSEGFSDIKVYPVLFFDKCFDVFFVFACFFIYFIDLGVHEKAVPKALQKMPDQALFPVKKPKFNKIAVYEIEKWSQKKGHICIVQLKPAFSLLLSA